MEIKPRVLIVEDVDYQMDIFEELVAELGYEPRISNKRWINLSSILWKQPLWTCAWMTTIQAIGME